MIRGSSRQPFLISVQEHFFNSSYPSLCKDTYLSKQVHFRISLTHCQRMSAMVLYISDRILSCIPEQNLTLEIVYIIFLRTYTHVDALCLQISGCTRLRFSKYLARAMRK